MCSVYSVHILRLSSLSSGPYLSNFMLSNQMTRTENTFTSWTAPSPGIYYITVVAYNRAIDPSDPVCSDGVVIDDTPPALGEIFLDNIRISAGIIKNSNGDVFYVNHQRYRYDLPDTTDDCR